MSFFKCKMCGGTIEFEDGATVGMCDSCGTKQTLPRLDGDRKANLYDRANHFRRNNDFDKAMGIYEQILNEDNTDAEVYWSLVLCRYGIEYVEDPQSHKRIPTVNRAQFTSIFADEDYKSALHYADGHQRSIYEEEAKAIDDIQKGILEISSKEEPFDVFICYKETDNNGRRTQDSVLATDLYHQLTQEGFKVFFSRITLEDKLGVAYEPYIFAALNSAKVMVVIGTKPEYFGAVWVKNEWSRYLALVKDSGGKKMLIPAYRDMDPYDLPEEFSHLQAQDMNKLGFMQDLIRGIKKIISADAPKATVKETFVVNANNASITPLLERAFLFLEDGKWRDADIYCEKVLDIDPKNAEAYLGKLMAELRVNNRRNLADCSEPFDDRDNFGKIIRFGDEALEAEIRGYITHINDRNENTRLTGIYENAQCSMQNAQSEEAYKKAAEEFKGISGFKDADTLVEECLDKAEICRKDVLYASGKSKMNGEKASAYEVAIQIFQTISGWKDADEQVYACQKKIEKIKAKEEADRLTAEKADKKRKKAFAIGTPILWAVIVFAIVWNAVIIPRQKLNKAMNLIDSGDYDSAYALLEEIGDSDAIMSNKCDRAKSFMDSGDYDSAYVLIEEIGDSDEIMPSKYDRAMSFIDSGDYELAYMLLKGLSYKDSTERVGEILSKKPNLKCKYASVGEVITFGAYEQDNNTSNGKEAIEWLVLAKEENKILVISDKALDCQIYNTSGSAVTWESCSLREWMNGTFLNAAFSAEEQAQIENTNVSADKNTRYGMDPGNTTVDKVFLLSITEAEKFFSSDNARQCRPTKYAVANGAHVDDNDNTCWWLRSPGRYQNYAASASDSGMVDYYGAPFNHSYYTYAVRPALWISLDS